MIRILRTAHPVDIARHLADSPHPAVSVAAITEGAGMGTAQRKLQEAMTAAIAAGYVTVADVDGKRMASLTDLGCKKASIYPEDHSIHLDGTHMPMTIEPGDVSASCSLCYRTYRDGAWQLLLPEGRNGRNQPLTMCLQCATDIGAAAARFPAEPAPWVEY